MGWLFPESPCAQCKSHAELHAKEGLFTTQPCPGCRNHSENGCGGS